MEKLKKIRYNHWIVQNQYNMPQENPQNQESLRREFETVKNKSKDLLKRAFEVALREQLHIAKDRIATYPWKNSQEKLQQEELFRRLDNSLFGLEHYFKFKSEEEADTRSALEVFRRQNKDLKEGIPAFRTLMKKLDSAEKRPGQERREEIERSIQSLLEEYENCAMDKQIQILLSLNIRKTDPELQKVEWKSQFFEKVSASKKALAEGLGNTTITVLELTAHVAQLGESFRSLKAAISEIETGSGNAEKLRKALWNVSTEERKKNARTAIKAQLKKYENEKLTDRIALARTMKVDRRIIERVTGFRFILELENIESTKRTATELEALQRALHSAIEQLNAELAKQREKANGQAALEQIEKEFLA